MVRFLVDNSCDMDIQDNEGWSAMHATSSCGFLPIAEYVQFAGAAAAAAAVTGSRITGLLVLFLLLLGYRCSLTPITCGSRFNP